MIGPTRTVPEVAGRRVRALAAMCLVAAGCGPRAAPRDPAVKSPPSGGQADRASVGTPAMPVTDDRDPAVAPTPACPAGTVLVRRGGGDDHGDGCERPDGVLHGPRVAYRGAVMVTRETYRDGKLDGPFERLAADGRIVERGQFKADRRDGTWIQYSEAGVELGRYQLELGTGEARAFFGNGKIAERAEVRDDELHGERRLYSRTGTLGVRETYRQGVLHGERTVGTRAEVAIEESWLDGKREGRRQLWRNNRLAIDEEWRAGKRHGRWIAYRGNGKLRVSGSYDDDEAHGQWTYFHGDGRVQRQGTYAHGKMTGTWTAWSQRGQKLFEGQYDVGLPTGTFTQWNDKGAVLGSYVLEKGTGTEKSWYETGGLETETELRRGRRHGLHRVYTSTGKLIVEAAYRDGHCDGRQRRWFGGGALRADDRCKHGLLDGTSTRYRSDGSLELQAEYRAGKRHGSFVEKFANSVVEVEGQFKEDLRTGLWIQRDPEGRLLSETHWSEGVLDGESRTIDLLRGVITITKFVEGRKIASEERPVKAPRPAAPSEPSARDASPPAQAEGS